MLTQHIALVPEASGVDPTELARVSAALQKQVTRELRPIWEVEATVDAFPRLEDVPPGYWPLVITQRPVGVQAGVHVDRSGQPYALVEARGHWSLDASRACLEMLTNPFELRTFTALSPRAGHGLADFLIEVCAPCRDARHAYVVNDVAVSDFCTPAYFETRRTGTDLYSSNGSLTAPFQLLRGGHITWRDSISDSWWLRNHWGENPIDTLLGAVDRKLFSVRELTRACTPLRSPVLSLPRETIAAQASARRASQVRAERMRQVFAGDFDAALDAAVAALQLSPETHAKAAPPAQPPKSLHASAPRRSSVPPPLPPARRSSVPHTVAPPPPPAARATRPLASSRPAPASIAAIDDAGAREVAAMRKRPSVVGGALGVAALVAVAWSAQAAITNATVQKAPAVAPPRAPLAAVTQPALAPTEPPQPTAAAPIANPQAVATHTKVPSELRARPDSAQAQRPEVAVVPRRKPPAVREPAQLERSAPRPATDDSAQDDAIERLLDTRR